MSVQYVWGGSDKPDVHDAISRWVSQRSFGHPNNIWPDGSSFGVIKDGNPVGGVVFHDYKRAAQTIQYSGGSIDRSWLKGPALHYMFSYMFDALGCQMVLTGNASTNTGLHRLMERTDHKKHVIERGWGREIDLFLWTLTKENWAKNDIMQRSKRWAEEKTNVQRT